MSVTSRKYSDETSELEMLRSLYENAFTVPVTAEYVLQNLDRIARDASVKGVIVHQDTAFELVIALAELRAKQRIFVALAVYNPTFSHFESIAYMEVERTVLTAKSK